MMKHRHLRLSLASGMAAQIPLWFCYCSMLLLRIGGRRIWALADDIYISACYARNFAAGNGLVWYPGAPRVEGFSNPFWVAVLALLHKLPGFREARLGLRLMLVQSILLLVLAPLFCRICLALGADDEHEASSTTRLAWLGLPGLGLLALPYWMAEGYEVGLIALFALGSFAVAASCRDGLSCRAAAGIGLLTALAGLTRLDGPLYCAGAWLLLLRGSNGAGAWRPQWRKVGAALAVVVTVLGAVMLARRTYYHAWLPNTYYLKIEHWPLAARVRLGVRQNWPLLVTAGVAWVSLAVPACRRRLGGARPAVVAALGVFTLAVAYSTHNGGDAWGLKFGYDRFAVIGGLFLILALAVLVLRLGRSGRSFAGALAGALLIAALPVLLDRNAGRLWNNLLRGQVRRYEPGWIAYGQAFRKVSRPGAAIALQPAGAIIYFSERGGLDLLGKCEPYVAHLPVNHPERPPGHNKVYVEELLERFRPEFARDHPPEEVEPLYRGMSYAGQVFYVRRDSPHARWSRMTPADLAARPVAHTIPTRMHPGQRVAATVTMLNAGDIDWSEAKGMRFAILEDLGGMAAAVAGRRAIEMGKVVKSGERYVFSLSLVAPASPGRYTLKFRMVEEKKYFFGQSLRLAVEVAPGAGA